MPLVDMQFDASAFEDFVRASPGEARSAATTWFNQGGQAVRALQVKEATRRFGVETGQSRMQHPDPSRPKGIWAGSVQVDVSPTEARIGPSVPYRWWAEQGSEAPTGVPASHGSSAFRGHRVVERAGKAAEEPVALLARRLFGAGVDRAVRIAGGTA